MRRVIGAVVLVALVYAVSCTGPVQGWSVIAINRSAAVDFVVRIESHQHVATFELPSGFHPRFLYLPAVRPDAPVVRVLDPISCRVLSADSLPAEPPTLLIDERGVVTVGFDDHDDYDSEDPRLWAAETSRCVDTPANATPLPPPSPLTAEALSGGTLACGTVVPSPLVPADAHLFGVDSLAGAVRDCSGSSHPVDSEQPLVAENPGDDSHRLRVTWTAVCTSAISVTLQPQVDHYGLDVLLLDTPCRDELLAYELELLTADAIDASALTVEVRRYVP